MKEENTIPKHWQIKKLGEVLDIQGGSQSSKSNFIFNPKQGYIQLLQIRDFGKNGVPTFVPLKQVTKFCKKDDILIARYGASLGRIVTGHEGAYNVALAKVIDAKGVFEKRFIYYLLNTQIFQTPLKMLSRSAQNGFSKGEIHGIELPIPPLSEQKKIVTKIEELISDLENGKQQLLIVQQQIKVYRQSLLKWAFEGRLTNKKVNEDGLPNEWKWVKIEEISISLDNKRKPINKNERLKRVGNIPYFGANGRVGWIDDYLFDEPLICVVEDETFTGRIIPFSYKISGKTWVNNHAHILKAKENTNIDFLNYQLSYYPFLPLTTGTTGRKKLTKYALMNAPIKICSLKEQQLIVDELESKLTVCDNIEETITQSLQQAETLRQSILKKAFEGKL